MENMAHHLHFEIERHHDYVIDGNLWNLYRQDSPICPISGELPTPDHSGFVRLDEYVYFIKEGSLYSFRIDGACQPEETERIELPDHDVSQDILGLVPHVDYMFAWTKDAIFKLGRTRRLARMQICEKHSAEEEYPKATHDLNIRHVAALAGLPNKVELLIQSTTNKVYKTFLMPPDVLVREVLFENDDELIGGFRTTIVMLSIEEGQETSLKLFEGTEFSRKVIPATRLVRGSRAFLDDHCIHVVNPEDRTINSMNILHNNLRWTTPKESVLVRGGWVFIGETGDPKPHWCSQRPDLRIA